MIQCVVIVEMVRPSCPWALWRRWKDRREYEAKQDYPASELQPDSSAHLRTWKGAPESRDFDRLIAFKQRDGWGLVSHRRELYKAEELTDKVES